jgi:prophage antirepressor-like protein
MSEETEREEGLAELARLRAQAEKAYDDMYEAHDQRAIDTCYRDAKEWLFDAIGLAHRLGLATEEKTLTDHLDHIKAVYHHQFFNP